MRWLNNAFPQAHELMLNVLDNALQQLNPSIAEWIETLLDNYDQPLPLFVRLKKVRRI